MFSPRRRTTRELLFVHPAPHPTPPHQVSLPGFAEYFRNNSLEEREHAQVSEAGLVCRAHWLLKTLSEATSEGVGGLPGEQRA